MKAEGCGKFVSVESLKEILTRDEEKEGLTLREMLEKELKIEGE